MRRRLPPLLGRRAHETSDDYAELTIERLVGRHAADAASASPARDGTHGRKPHPPGWVGKMPDTDLRRLAQSAVKGRRRVLNAGSGPPSQNSLHPAFAANGWQEVRLDVDRNAAPDILGSVSDMRALVPDAAFDAVWSSHNIEHLHPHEVVPSMREFRRVLKPEGFVLMTCPDLAAVSALVLERGLDATIYQSPAGPITPLDMIYGHVRSVARGNTFMCHHCGFTEDTLASVAVSSGFSEVRVAKGRCYDLWAIFLMPAADLSALRNLLKESPEHDLVAA